MQHQRNVHVGMDQDRVGTVEEHADWSSNLDPAIFPGGREQLRRLYGQASMAAWMTIKSSKFAGPFEKWDRRFFVLHGVTLRYYKSEADARQVVEMFA